MPTQFPVTIELSDLDGTSGFVINGIAGGDHSGFSVSDAGDVNGDGIDDIIISGHLASPNGATSGQSYVIFGGVSVGSSGIIELSNLNGNNGFKINGLAAGDECGTSVHGTADINTDGIADLIVGAYKANPNGADSGQSYVVFGGSSIAAAGTLELSDLNGSNGFKINGISAGDQSGWPASSAGDINVDGVDDLIIGAWNAAPNGAQSGQSYVVFGGVSVGAGGTLELSSLNGVNGFKLNGVASSDISGRSVASAGDINNDSIADLIIGAPGGTYFGQCYVVFGGVSVGSSGTIELSSLNGTNGFRLAGIIAGDSGGISGSAGDINADGLTDLIIGAAGADPNGPGSGQSYIVFGNPILGSNGVFELSSLNGTNGFTINGIAAGDLSGSYVHSNGDVNGDEVADLVIGASQADPNGVGSGQSYVVFGGSSVGSSGVVELSALNGANGFKLNGVAAGNSCTSVSTAGDVNADGVTDIIIGALYADPNGANSGQSYVVFGSPVPQHTCNTLVIKQNERLVLTTENLNATYTNSQFQSFYPSIYYSASNIQQGGFEYGSNPGVAITGFTQQDIIDQAVNFVHNGADAPPSYDVIARPRQGSIWGSSIPLTVTYYAVPKLLKNTLTLTEGETITFTDANLKSTDSDANDADLQFIISNLQRGRFEFKNQPGQVIQTFTQQQITLGNVVFVSDGSESPPTYRVSVSDGITTTNPEFADITYFTVNDSPVLNNYRILVKTHKPTLVSSSMLQATDEETKDADLIFKVFNVTHGHFERFAQPGLPINQFEQRDIINNNIQFSADGDILPGFAVSVSDGQAETTPQTATVEWDNNSNPGSLVVNTKSNTVRNAIIGSTISGFVGLLFLAIKIYVKRKSDKQMQKALEGDTESAAGRRAQYFKDVVSPIAKKIFSKFSIKNFFGISDKKLGEFFDAIAKLVDECHARGVPVNNFPNMEPAKATILINEIAKQTKQVLAPTSSITGTIVHFFKRQITPEQLEDASVMIASFVKTAWDSSVNRASNYSRGQGVEMVSLGPNDTATSEFAHTNPIFGGDAGAGVGAGSAVIGLTKPSEYGNIAELMAGFKEEFVGEIQELRESNQEIRAENAELREEIEQLKGKQNNLPPNLPPPIGPPPRAVRRGCLPTAYLALTPARDCLA